MPGIRLPLLEASSNACCRPSANVHAAPRNPQSSAPSDTQNERKVYAVAMKFFHRLAVAGLVAAGTSAAFAAKKPPAPLSVPARTLVQWVTATRDNGSVPFAVIDKRQARIWVFDDKGRLQDTAPVLLGYARGDDTVPGIGDKPLKDVKPSEKTTPAGRFVTEPGRNLNNEDIFWVDYDAAVSMHRVRATNPKERRLQRLASPTPADNRISFGCINVPAAFYDRVVNPAFSRARGIVYLLPEVKSLGAVFKPLAERAAAAG